MSSVVAIILHAVPAPGAGELERSFAAARHATARAHAAGFEAAGATARVIEVQPGGAPFGTRLRRLAALDAGSGLVILGSGSVPLARPNDYRAFVGAAATDGGPVLANNSYSADVVAIPADVNLSTLPELTSDNGLPRWLEEHDYEVIDLRRRSRLQVDLDSPLDVFLIGHAPPDDPMYERVRSAVDGIRRVTGDPKAELLVAGRTSSASLRWLERATASRTRSLAEERGLRTAAPGQRPARTTLGMLLDREGPAALGRILGELGDGAVIDTRVILAHRLGPDETALPPAEDRFASDLLLHERVQDPWLRDLTRAAAEARIPVLLGGHTLVGPGLRLVIGTRRRPPPP